jgi:hypothetical protein
VALHFATSEAILPARAAGYTALRPANCPSCHRRRRRPLTDSEPGGARERQLNFQWQGRRDMNTHAKNYCAYPLDSTYVIQ